MLYILIKQGSLKQNVCPVCGKPYAEPVKSSLKDDLGAVATTAVNIAKDPTVRDAAKELKEDLKDLQDTFSV